MFSGPFARQREKLALRLDEVLRQYLSDTATPEVNDTLEEVYGEFAIGKYPETREMRFFLQDVNCFTPELANRLRRLVSREFPKWTVVPQFNECVFTVRPDGVIFNGELARGDVSEDTPPFARWKAAAWEFDERRYGPLRRQLRWVVPRVPGCLKRLESERVVPVGAFDLWPPFDGCAVWLMLGTQDKDAGPLPQTAPVLSHAVNPDGTLEARYSERYSPLVTDRRPAAWLHVFLRKPTHTPELTVVSSDGLELAQLVTPPVVSDTELKAVEGGA